jgi:hypothetical protein
MRILTAVAVTACLLAAAPAAAQDGTVRGVVKDSAGKAIGDADVSIVELHQLTRTDDKGNFIFTRLARGEHEVMIRRLGFKPEVIKVMVNDLAFSYDVTMTPQAAVLAAMETNASEARLARGLEDFYRRRARGTGGTFFTREEILKRNASRTSEVLRNTPGIRVVRGRTGNGVRFTQASSSKRNDCIPVVWLDGQEVQGMEIDDISVTDIEAIELYSGPSTTPMQFSQKWAKDACGTIVVWTRIPGTP